MASFCSFQSLPASSQWKFIRCHQRSSEGSIVEWFWMMFAETQRDIQRARCTEMFMPPGRKPYPRNTFFWASSCSSLCFDSGVMSILTASVHTSHMLAPWKRSCSKCYAMHWMSLHTSHMPKPNVTRVQSATEWTASVHTLHMPKPNVTRVQSATEWTASVHTLHMPKPNVTRVQSATEWTASVHTLHMPKPNVTRVQSATEWTASVHTLHMPKPNVTRVQSALEWTASVHTLHMPKPNVTRVQSATEWTASVHTLHMPKPNVTRVQSATEWTASVHTLHMPKPNVTRVQSATEWTASVHTLHMLRYILYTGPKLWNSCSSKADQTHRRAEDRGKKNPARFVAARDRRTQGTIETHRTRTWISTSWCTRHPLKPLRNQQYKYSRSHS